MGNVIAAPSEDADGFEVVQAAPDSTDEPIEEEPAPNSPAVRATLTNLTTLVRQTSLHEREPEETVPVAADDQMDDPTLDQVQLGDYLLFKQRQLGKGSFAVVYIGQHIPSGMLVAIKVIGVGRWYEKNKITKGIKALPPKQLAYIESEIKMQLQSSGHPNVVSLHSVVRSTEGRYMYLVMELCEGGTLKDFLHHSGGSFDEVTARMFLRQLAGGLYWIKTRPGNSEFVHRDLKPENFMLSETAASATLKIADFGFARIPDPDDDGMLRSVVGTPIFMAPEIHNRQAYNDTADLWAIGIVLFQSVFGRVLTKASSLEEMKQKLSDLDCYLDDLEPAEIEVDRLLSPHCRDLLLRLLNPDPSKRITFSEFMSHPFIDLATAFVEQGQQLTQQVRQTEFHQRAFELLRDRLTDIQQNGRVVEETHELERAGMYEQAAQSTARIRQLESENERLKEEVQKRQQDEQEAIKASIASEQARVTAEQKLVEVEERTPEPEASTTPSKGIVVDRSEISAAEPPERVLFLRRNGKDGQVAFAAVCASAHAYYLHKDCLSEGDENKEHLVGDVLGLEPTDGNTTMLFATLVKQMDQA